MGRSFRPAARLSKKAHVLNAQRIRLRRPNLARRRRSVALVATGAAVFLTMAAGVASANPDSTVGAAKVGSEADPVALVQTLSDGLDALAPYVSGEPGSQVLDETGALGDGVDREIVALGAEVVAAQNQLVAQARAGVAVDASRVSPQAYPRLAELRRVASEAAVLRAADGKSALDAAAEGGVSIAATNACGTYDYPIPAYTPTRYNISGQGNIETYFSNQGFHPTDRYACGESGVGQCTSDWTKSRSYASALGTCAAPRFRNQGFETGTTTGWAQYGEPNPEILGYTWPYWNWGNYVQWWHGTY